MGIYDRDYYRNPRPRGHLRLNTGTAFARHRLAKLLPEFAERYPDITIDLSVSDRRIDHDGIGRHMVALTTYLGHSDIRNTYWYLEAPPALFATIATRCEEFAIGGNQ